MKTYLFTWNPKTDKGRKWKDYESDAIASTSGKPVRGTPSCSINKRKITKGDRAFLVYLGKEPKGIIAFGRIIAGWNKKDSSLNVVCLWERLLNPDIDHPLLLRNLPTSKTWTLRNWTPRSSGGRIPDDIATKLEKLWSRHLAKLKTQANKTHDSEKYIDDELAALEGKEQKKLVRHRYREQKLRQAKISQSRRLHNGHLLCEVKGCGFDFESQYGKLGHDYAQVHHLKPLSDRTTLSETKLSDLAIVCANCHVMIHRGGKCRKLEGLIP